MLREGKVIYSGTSTGPALLLDAPLSFYGGVDAMTGRIIQEGHPQKGACIAGTILFLPHSTGSTVGTWTILRLKKNGVAPAGFVTFNTDTVLAAGAIIAQIPHIDGLAPPASPGQVSISGGVMWSGPLSMRPQSPQAAKIETRSGSGVVVKLGGSLITHKEAPSPTVNEARLYHLAALLATTGRPLIVVHGAGSYGHGPVLRNNLLTRPLGADTRPLWEEILLLQYELNALIAKALISAGLQPWSLQSDLVTGDNISPRGRGTILRDVIAHGFTPLLYGVPAMARGGEMRIISGDETVVACARSVGYDTIVHLTDVDGVFADPTNREAGVLPLISPEMNYKFRADGSAKPDVTGGMMAKLEPLLCAARDGITSYIVNGTDDDAVLGAFAGEEVGTRILPPPY